jgi:sarcosine oxidase subunit alpha
MVAVPARFGHAMAQALMQAGLSFGIAPYGTEALGVMRIEKGHVAGNELDGRTTAADLGLGRMMSKNKDYVGRVMAERPGLLAPERQTLVGLSPAMPTDRLRDGAHMIPVNAVANAANAGGSDLVAPFAFASSLDPGSASSRAGRASRRAHRRGRSGAQRPRRNRVCRFASSIKGERLHG